MIPYNTQQKKVVLPEYGRHIQEMAQYCLSIEDKDERTRCAAQIVAAMAKVQPSKAETQEGRRKLWDHLQIMCGFNLDIDWPFEPINEEETKGKMDQVPYNSHYIRLRHYGHGIEQALEKAAAMEPGGEKDELVLMIASQMKKLLAAISPDNAGDERVFNDIAFFTQGALVMDPAVTHLPEFKVEQLPQQAKKKRKRKK